MHTVHVRFNDAATGQPTPCRVRFTDADGHYFAPFGRQADFATGRNQDVGGNVLIGRKPHACIDGTCEISLPAGPLPVSEDLCARHVCLPVHNDMADAEAEQVLDGLRAVLAC